MTTVQTIHTANCKPLLEQFQIIAIAHKLSAGAILLWQHIYFIAQTQDKFANLHLRTADLLETLHITRNGLQKIRRNLVNAGLLNVRVDARQQVYYTLLINGETINQNEKTKSKSSPSKPKKNRTGNPSTPKYVANSGDILQNNAYRKLIDAFCTQHDAKGTAGLSIRLQQFLHYRKQQGKTLTKAGLDALLDKLMNLAASNARTMVDIIQQSITRGWYGFYPYKPITVHNPWHSKPSRLPKYDTKKEDLDFLEW